MHLSSNMQNHIGPLLQRTTYKELNSLCSKATCEQSIFLAKIWETARQSETGFLSNESTDIVLQAQAQAQPQPQPQP